MAARSTAFEEVRGWHPYGKIPTRHRRSRAGKGVYVLEVAEFGFMQCHPRNPPVLGPLMKQDDAALLTEALATVQSMVTLNQLAWPEGRADAQIKFGIKGWPPNPQEVEEDRKRRHEATTHAETVPADAEEPRSTEASWLGDPVAAAPAPTPVSQPALGWGPIIMATDLAAGTYEEREGMFWPLAG